MSSGSQRKDESKKTMEEKAVGPSIPPLAEELEKLLHEESEKTEAYRSQMTYLQADFDNYKKRVEKTLAESKQSGSDQIIMSLLSIIDELELALSAAKNKGELATLLQGVDMTLKKLQGILGKEGLTRIESVGKKFDPNIHEVVAKEPVEGKEEGMIIDEIRSGYLLRGKLLRPSMVRVAVAPTAAKEA
ncbi:MAG: nucleotide exchange factor GrpE [Thaumarchaeota archaeon]|nr:nucleotide exchange factor GrpE [Nitrososphaerota archaeon]